jgi:phosphoglycerol transferase
MKLASNLGHNARLIVWAVGLLLFFMSFARILTGVGLLPLKEGRTLALGLAFLVFCNFRPRNFSSIRIFHFLTPLLLPLVMTAVWFGIRVSYGEFNLPAILSAVLQPQDTGNIFGMLLKDLKREFVIAGTLLAGVLLMFAFDGRFYRRRYRLTLLFILLNPLTIQTALSVNQYYFGPATDLVAYYKPPQITAVPFRKLNVIHLLLEATEQTLDQSPITKTVMEPLEPFRRRALEVRGVKQTEYTGWSIAGLIASNCGIPLLTPGLHTITSWAKQNYKVLSGSECLPEILAKQAYENVYVYGVEISFVGNDSFVHDNGWARHIARAELEKRGAKVLPGGWGIEDSKLLDAAYDEAIKLRGEGKNFLISVATTGAHPPSGFLSEKCLGRDSIKQLSGNRFLQAYRCLNELTAEFLTRLEQAGVLEDTLVIVQSDHLATAPAVTSLFPSKNRQNMLFFLGPNINSEVLDKTGSVMDIYPTVLELLGYTLVDGRANLGSSLLSEKPTVTEQLGLELFDGSLLKDRKLRLKLWGLKDQ